jgi:hypothetical protein
MKDLCSCDICGKNMVSLWEISKGVAPNRYFQHSYEHTFRHQNIFYCEPCNLITNRHNFSIDDLFGDYVYRTPNTVMDEEIVKVLSDFIKERELCDIVEVAGNNGVFAEKLVKKIGSLDPNYTIVDSVPLSVDNNNINHIDTFFEADKEYLFDGLNPELVIIRHALAHNKSIRQFFGDIAQILNPNYIYIENASLIETVRLQDYSQFYSEHFFQVSPRSIRRVAKIHGYAMLDLRQYAIHNGSFGIFLHKEGVAFESGDQFIETRTIDRSLRAWRRQARDFWCDVRDEGRKVVVWGCSAKFIFAFSALDLGEVWPISYIVDSTPEKQGLYAPGMTVPILDESSIRDLPDDVLFIIGARNFADHIRPKILHIKPSADILCPPF